MGGLALVACAPTPQARSPVDRPVAPHTPLTRPLTSVEPVGPVSVLPAPSAPSCPGSGTWALEDVAECAGLAQALHILVGDDPNSGAHYATGQAWLDLDGDTWLDLVVTSGNGWNRAYSGRPDGQLVARSEPALVGLSGFSIVPADLDGDGDRDLVLGGTTDQLLRNDGGSLVALPGPDDPRNTLGVSYADLDADGLPEVFTTNWFCDGCDPGWDLCRMTRDALWADPLGGWTDLTEGALGTTDIPVCGLGFTSVFGDYDNDGDLDLYVGNDKGVVGHVAQHGEPIWRNTYWRNDGPGCGSACFSEHALDNGTAAWIDTMGVDTADVDDDGDLDLLLSDSGELLFLENQGDGTFTDATAATGLGVPLDGFGWGVVWFDLENDGDLDVYVGVTGRDTLLRNDGGWFTDISPEALDPVEGSTRGVATADYDRDGRVDLIVGDVGGRYRLLRNTAGAENHWLGLRLQGHGAGGTDALGARVWLTDSSGRTQLREVKSGSSNGGGSDLGLHFGLGASEPVAVRVRWPDGTEQTIDPALDAWSLVRKSD